MNNSLKKYLALSQVSLLGLLIICCLITPSVVIKNGGVSNFGNHKSTVELYVLAFSLCMFFLYLAAQVLLNLNKKLRGRANLLLILALFNLLVLLSTFPRHISYTYSDIHDYLGIVLFAYELALSVWFITRQKGRQASIFLLVELLGSIIGMLSILKVIHFLFIGQMLGAIGFGVLLVTLFPRIIAAELKNNKLF